MATIGDVARRAGVSRTAVSFAFNKPEQLAEETLQRILDVAYELGYYPNPAARSLNTGRTGILGVLIPECAAIVYANPFTLDFLKGVGRVSDRHGLTMLLVSPLQGSLTHAMNNVPVDGFITLGLGVGRREVELLHRRKVPFVVVDALAPQGVSSVEVDDVGGATAAAAYLLDAGHRRVLILALPARRGDEDDPIATGRYDVPHRRLRGYARAFEARGLAFPTAPEGLVSAESTIEGGARALRPALRSPSPPTAILAMSDALAMGALRAAREAGLRVPDDLSVVGFDDVEQAALTNPPLTTVHQPVVEKGRQAAELLVRGLGGAIEPGHRVFPTSLVVRDSVRRVSP